MPNQITFYKTAINKATKGLSAAQAAGDPVLIKKHQSDLLNYRKMLQTFQESKQ